MTSNQRERGYGATATLLRARLAEEAPGRIQLLTGPRQVGKTTLLLELAAALGPSAIYTACDSPEAAIPGFWEQLFIRAGDVAQRNASCVIFLDEVQHVGDWAARLKAEWDRIRRLELPVHIVASGSSALGLGTGSKESLAGRFERIALTHWSAACLAAVFGIDRDEAAELVVRQGAYPGAMEYRSDPVRWSSYVRDAIIEPAIGRDIIALGPVRKPALLRQVFAAAVVAPSQILSLQKMQGQLQDKGALETIAHYLSLLEEASLVAPLQKHSTRPLRRRSAPPKLVVLSNALCSAIVPHGSPDPDAEPARYGAWVENACLAFAYNSGQHVAYWREEPLEIDAVVEGSWGKWAIEVKTGRFGLRDLGGLLEFTRRFPAYRPLVVCRSTEREVADRAGVDATTWTEFLLSGPPGLTPAPRTTTQVD